MEHKFSWVSRYSGTEDFDKHGRWARLCYFDNKLIAWVNKHKYDDGKCAYRVVDYFPTTANDMPHFISIEKEKSFETIQKETEERFIKFFKEIKEMFETKSQINYEFPFSDD